MVFYGRYYIYGMDKRINLFLELTHDPLWLSWKIDGKPIKRAIDLKL